MTVAGPMGPDQNRLMQPAATSTATDPPRRFAFPAFRVRNFRIFVAGQSVSLIGSWTETVAQGLLILQLTNSGVVLGLATAARYLPVLLLTPYAGLIVDRHDKRKILMLTATGLASLSVIACVLVATHAIAIWMVFALAIAFGCMTALDNPARQAFIPEMVDRDLVRNAVTLNSTFVNVGRAVGPVVAGVVAATLGLAWCFAINAVSFAAVLVALALIRASALHPATAVQRAKGQLLEGFRYAVSRRDIIVPLVMMALIGTFTYEFEVSLPLLAEGPLHGGAPGYSWLIAAFGTGSVIGGLYCLARPATGVPRLIRAAALYAVAMAATGFAPSVAVATALLVVVGMASITFITTGNATIQLAASPQMRGRVTALWSTAFVGSTPIGAAIIGAVGAASPRWAIWLGAAACVAAAVAAWAWLKRPEPTNTAI